MPFSGSAILVYIALFVAVGNSLYPDSAPETLLIRAFSTAAFGLLHIILSIGPLSRLSARFLPLLYNRRHLGVMMALVASAHAFMAIMQFHGFGSLNPILSVLLGDGSFSNLGSVPFQIFGLLAWTIIVLMAATSHDFWLTQLSAPTWKRLHMLLYFAYAFLVAHVLFGIVQDSASWTPMIITAMGSVWIVSIHLIAAFRVQNGSLSRGDTGFEGFMDVCHLDDIPDGRAIGVLVSGERVAVFKNDSSVFAVSGVCQHQNGPLAEGHVIDGLVTCPWHGYQYCPLTGKSPEPFTEIIPTFQVRVEDNRVLVAIEPAPRGSETQAVRFYE